MNVMTQNVRPKDLKLDKPQNQKVEANPKTGNLRNRTFALIILGSASVIAATAAVVAGIFASYIVAAVCAVAFITFAISTLVVSQIKAPEPKKLEQGLQEPLKNELLKKQVQAELDAHLLEIDDLKKIIANHKEQEPVKKAPEIKQANAKIITLENENKKLKDQLDQELKIKQDEIDKLNERLNLAEKGPQDEVESLKKQLKTQNAEFKAKVNALEKDADAIRNEAGKKLLDAVSKNLDETIKKTKDKKKKNKYVQLAILQKEFLNNPTMKDTIAQIGIMTKREHLENQGIANFDEIKLNLKKQNRRDSVTQKIIEVDVTKKMNDNFTEILETEKSFLGNMQKLRKNFDGLYAEKLISDEEFKEMTSGWDSIITESSLLIEKLKILDDPTASLTDKIIVFQKTFSSKEIKNYLDAFIIPVSHYISFNKKTEEITKTEKGKVLKAEENLDYIIMPAQRLPRIELFMQTISSLIQSPDNLKKAINHNHSYLKTSIEMINRLTPTF